MEQLIIDRSGLISFNNVRYRILQTILINIKLYQKLLKYNQSIKQISLFWLNKNNLSFLQFDWTTLKMEYGILADSHISRPLKISVKMIIFDKVNKVIIVMRV